MMLTMTTHDVCPRFSGDTLAHCGIHTVCTNSHGSWSCPCASGYQDFVASVGCSDINECTDSNWGYWVGSVQIIIGMNIHHSLYFLDLTADLTPTVWTRQAGQPMAPTPAPVTPATRGGPPAQVSCQVMQ